MKRIFLLLICICFLPTLTGCWDRVEVNDLAIITAAAIDRMEDGKTMISVQLFIPRAITSGEKGEDPSKGSTFVREATGDNVANAVSRLQDKVPRRLFWGHSKVYIFGEEYAKNGIRNAIDYLTRHPSPRGNSLLFVSKGESKEILALIPPLERYSAMALQKLTQAEKGFETTLINVDMGLMGDSEAVSMPYINKLLSGEPARKEHETIPYIEGTAVFQKDVMVGVLNMNETRGLLWLKDSVRGSTLTIKLEDKEGEISMTPTLGKIHYSPLIKDGTWIMNLHIDMEGDIVQNETHVNLANEETMKKLKSKFEEALKERVTQALEKLQKEYQTDVIELGKRFHQKYPKEWHKEKHNWNEKFAEVKVNIDVHAKVRRPGYVGPPAGLPFDEVEE